MRRLVILPIVLAMLCPALAEDWSVNGKLYKNVVVVDRDDDGVRINYDGGLGMLPYYDLPLDVQKRFGEDYDSLQAKKKAADLKMAKRDEELAAQQKIQDATAAGQNARRLPWPPSGSRCLHRFLVRSKPVRRPPSRRR